jgi:type II secretory pathway component PulF
MNNAVQQSEDMHMFNNAIDKLIRETELLNIRFAEEIGKFDILLQRMHYHLERSEKYANRLKES